MAFFAGEWERVLDYLGRYLARYEGDYEANFYIAEVYRSLGLVEQAKPYYLVALRKIRLLKKHPFPIRLTRVRIQQRIGKSRQALAGYHRLIAEQPENPRLKADMVELMLAEGMVQEAENLLHVAGFR